MSNLVSRDYVLSSIVTKLSELSLLFNEWENDYYCLIIITNPKQKLVSLKMRLHCIIQFIWCVCVWIQSDKLICISFCQLLREHCSHSYYLNYLSKQSSNDPFWIYIWLDIQASNLNYIYLCVSLNNSSYITSFYRPLGRATFKKIVSTWLDPGIWRHLL